MSTNPVLRDLPEEFLTPRLRIRCPRPGDGAVVHEAVEESFPELRTALPWARHPSTLEERETYVRLAQARYLARKDMPLLIFRREDGRFLGGSGLHDPDWTVPRFEIGYWLRTSETGKGYITEAVAEIARVAFEALGARRVEIHCDARNEKSAAVARRLGFEQEGRLRNLIRAADGEVTDVLVFARVSP